MRITGANYAFVDESGKVGGEALLHMRSKPPNEDGTIGFMVEPGTVEWLAWEAYFAQTQTDDIGVVSEVFPKQLAHMRSRASSRKPYMVPDRLPWFFDPSFTADKVKPKPLVRLSRDMTQEERNEMAERVKAEIYDPKRVYAAAKKNWAEAMYRLCPDRNACIAILKDRPDLVDRATDAELRRHGMGWGEIRAEVEAIYWNNHAQKEAAE